MKHQNSVALSFLVALAPGCAAGNMGDVDDGPEPEAVDAGNVEASDAAPPIEGDDSAMVMSVNRPGVDTDTVEIWTVAADGSMVDRGQSFGPIDNPRRVAMRSDGREAICAWGTLGGAWGVSVIQFDADGQNAELVQELAVGSGRTIFGLSYASDDQAIVAVSGGGEHSLVGLGRNGLGEFAVGNTTPVENDWPLEIIEGPDGKALVHRANLQTDSASELIPLEQSDTGWVRAGTSGLVSPVALHAVRAGDRIYSPSSDPNDRVTAENLETGGILHSFDYSGAEVESRPTFALPNAGSTIVADPQGGYLVVSDIHYELTANGQPIARGLRLQTIELGEGETPEQVIVEDNVIPALLVEGAEISSDGVLVLALSLYLDQVPTGGTQHSIQGYRRVDSHWQPSGMPTFVDGLTQIATAH